MRRRCGPRYPAAGARRAHLGTCRSRPPRRPLDGPDDARVSSAAAEVRVERLADLRLAGRALVLQQRDGAYDHAGNAVAALRCLLLEEGLLHGMQLIAGSEPLERHDAPPGEGLHGRRATRGGLAVDENRTRIALLEAASELGRGQAEIVAQHRQQRRPGIGADDHTPAVDVELDLLRHAAGPQRAPRRWAGPAQARGAHAVANVFQKLTITFPDPSIRSPWRVPRPLAAAPPAR